MFILKCLQFGSQRLVLQSESFLRDFVRFASKKSATSTKNVYGDTRPKSRGWKKQDGCYVQAGMIVATQRTTRFHPGLNVCFGKNGTLCAIIPGRVLVTCEKFQPKWSHTWVQRHYKGREDQIMYKKYFNVLPDQQHTNFKLIDQI